MIFERQKRLLVLLDIFGGDVNHLDFQKLLFLFCQESEAIPIYEFVPYKYGGFSFTSYADKRRLIEEKLLENDERAWKITFDGRQKALVHTAILIQINQFAKRYIGLSGDKLVAEAYRRYPYYAIHSDIIERVLSDDNLTRTAIKEARPKRGLPGICTIGYEGLSLEGYLNRLILDGVTLLCDVRRNPLSRKYGFSKQTLAKSCDAVGIRYEHIPELGIASDYRRNLDTQADYDALFIMYEQDILPHQKDSLKKIYDWVEKGERVALTCYEKIPQQCHRNSLATELELEFGRTFTPIHLR